MKAEVFQKSSKKIEYWLYDEKCVIGQELRSTCLRHMGGSQNEKYAKTSIKIMPIELHVVVGLLFLPNTMRETKNLMSEQSTFVWWWITNHFTCNESRSFCSGVFHVSFCWKTELNHIFEFWLAHRYEAGTGVTQLILDLISFRHDLWQKYRIDNLIVFSLRARFQLFQWCVSFW